MRTRDSSAITDGTAQDARFPAPLHDHYFDVDERPFENVIARTAEFAKLIRYYNVHNQKSGDWKDLFASDDAVVMADIVATDSVRMEAEFLARVGNSAEAARFLIRHTHRINGWFMRLLEAEGDAGILSRQIAMLVKTKLREVLHVGVRFFAAGYAGEPVRTSS